MGVFLNLLLCSMLIGVLGGIPLGTGVFIYVHDIVLIAGLLYGSISLRSQKHIPIPRLLKPILLFTAVGFLSLLVNATSFPLPDLMRSSLYLIRWVLYACLYVLIVAQKIPARIMLLRLFQFGCAFAILGILQFLLYPNLRFLLYLGWDPHYYRLFSTLLDPNFAGIMLVFTTLLGYYLFKKEGNITLVFWIVFLICCVYLTYSRSSYLALITGAFMLGLLQKQWKIMLAILFFIVCILFIPRPGGNTLSLLREDSTFSRISN